MATSTGGQGTNLFKIGLLEVRIMRVVWELDGMATVRQVYEALRKERRIAYTTIMTVMNNLMKKKLLSQDKSKIAYVYTATWEQGEFLRELIRLAVKNVSGDNIEAARDALEANLKALD